MKFLIFLLLGTLIFGFTFPAFIIGIGVLAMILLGVIIAIILARGNNGTFFKVYTNNPYSEDSNDDTSETVFTTTSETQHKEEPDIFEEEGEVIELPESALRKEK
ncbi:MAG: hypothetical protein RR272_05085 [Synergistaceae bacterium]